MVPALAGCAPERCYCLLTPCPLQIPAALSLMPLYDWIWIVDVGECCNNGNQPRGWWGGVGPAVPVATAAASAFACCLPSRAVHATCRAQQHHSPAWRPMINLAILLTAFRYCDHECLDPTDQIH